MVEVSLILPDIRSTHNVGSIFRSAEIFGVKHIYICGYSPYPIYNGDTRLPHLANKLDKQISKTALGTEKIVPFSYIADPNDAVKKAKKDGNKIFALEQNAKSTPLDKLSLSGKIAIILGREVEGIEENLLSQCQEIIEIPQIGTKESLNIASACAIMLYDICINKSK